MAIETIQVCGLVKPKPQEGMALIYITNQTEGLPLVETARGIDGDGFDSVTIIRARHGGDVAAVLHDRLTSLDFESNEDLVVAIYSDCTAISAYDAAFIAHIDMPTVQIETQNGCRVTGFKTVVRPIVDDEFEAGCMAALDGIPLEANPNRLGSIDHDHWVSGHQAQVGGVNVASH